MLGLGLPLFTQRVGDVSDPPCSPSDPARALLVEHGVQPPPEVSARTRVQHLAQAACWRHGSAHQHRVLENKKGKGEKRKEPSLAAPPSPPGSVRRRLQGKPPSAPPRSLPSHRAAPKADRPCPSLPRPRLTATSSPPGAEEEEKKEEKKEERGALWCPSPPLKWRRRRCCGHGRAAAGPGRCGGPSAASAGEGAGRERGGYEGAMRPRGSPAASPHSWGPLAVPSHTPRGHGGGARDGRFARPEGRVPAGGWW